jgi:Flp pilus assembly protein TadD
MSTQKDFRFLAIALILMSRPCFPESSPTRQQEIAAHKAQAHEFLKEKRPDLAISQFRALVALDPNDSDARANLGVLLFFQSDYANAIPLLRAALKIHPTPWKLQALLGMAEKRTGDGNSARTDLEEAFPKLQEPKIRVETGMELIELYSSTGDLEKAGVTAGALRRLEPTNLDVLYAAYRIYSDLAGEAMLSVSMVAPKSARMHQIMAHELARQGRTTEAIANYREAIKIDPNVPGLHYELAEMLNSSQVDSERAEAEAEYKAALAANQFDEKSECRLGDIATRKGDLEEAAEHYSRAVQIQPNDPDANSGLAKALMQTNQPQKAESLLERAVQLDPTSAVAHYRLSTLYRQIGRTDDAKLQLEEFQKYKAMKDKLRDIYRDMRLEPAKEDEDSAASQK